LPLKNQAMRARALRTSPVVSPPSIAARIGSNSVPGSAPATSVSPQLGKVSRCAQFEYERFLAPGDLDCLQERGFRPRPLGLRPLQRDPAVEPMQFGEPE
jgi:hypothetical protein